MNYLLETHFFFVQYLKKDILCGLPSIEKSCMMQKDVCNRKTLPFYKLIFHFLKIANQVNFEHVLPKNLCSRNNFC